MAVAVYHMGFYFLHRHQAFVVAVAVAGVAGVAVTVAVASTATVSREIRFPEVCAETTKVGGILHGISISESRRVEGYS